LRDFGIRSAAAAKAACVFGTYASTDTAATPTVRLDSEPFAAA
jgi:hypothetical protein